MQINEKCPGCQSSIMFDTDLDKTKDLKEWRKFHSQCVNPEPKVKGTGTAWTTASREDPNHEFWNGRQKNPIVWAKAIPFGFVTNEVNEKWNR